MSTQTNNSVTTDPYQMPGAWRAPAQPPHGLLTDLKAHWLSIAVAATSTYVILPWLAPVFAWLGLWGAADAIWTVYAFLCHQLPERAGHLFGYEAAICFRCSAIYAAISLSGMLYAYGERNPRFFGWLRKPLPWQIFLLALLPIGADGLTHMFGLRETNSWFDSLTGLFFGDFSVGDSVGTLNWWLRISSGSLLGFCAGWLIFPWVDRAVHEQPRPYAPVAPAPAK